MQELYSDYRHMMRDPPGRDEYGNWKRQEYNPVDRKIDRPSSPLIEKRSHYERPEPRLELPSDIRSAETVFESQLKKLKESGL